MSGVIRKQDRSEEELKRDGFKQYPRKKSLILARKLSASEAPLSIRTNWGETLVARAGYMICYDTGDKHLRHTSDYDHWPVEPNIFDKTYKAWDEPFNPTPAQKELMAIGCKPYYKAVGIWAKPLDKDVYIQGLEHAKPVLVPEERVLAIGADGEPYTMGDETFHDRYDGTLADRPNSLKAIAKRLLKFFGGE
jgi:hypothetical protein